MTRDEVLDQWRRVTAALDAETGHPSLWVGEPPAHFLHAFRHAPSRIRELFEGLPEMAPVLERLSVVFDRAGAETGHLYFVVSRPRQLTDDDVRRHARAWLKTVGAWVQDLGLDVDDDAREFLSNECSTLDVVVEPDPRSSPGPIHPIRAVIYDAISAFDVVATTSEADCVALLREPLYMLACSYELAYWVLTPRTPWIDEDPFASFAALWEAGVSLEFVGAGKHIGTIARRSHA